MSPLFSIIIPTYNRVKLLEVAIQSVIDQTFNDWELIIVDDGSTDETANFIKKITDNRIRYVYQKNKKLSAARNTGVKNSIGKYVCFLDDDDYYLENHLESFYNYLAQNNFPLVILRTALYFKKSNETLKGPFYDENVHKNPLNWAAYSFCGTVTLCVPIQVFHTELFISGTEPWEDTHFILRILAKHPFVQLPLYTYIYIQHEVMGSRTMFTQKDTLKIAEQNVESMRHLFKNYGELINPYLPKITQAFIISKKYSDHAVSSILFENYKVVLELTKRALKADPCLYHWKNYLKILILYPLKKLTGYPKIK